MTKTFLLESIALAYALSLLYVCVRCLLSIIRSARWCSLIMNSCALSGLPITTIYSKFTYICTFQCTKTSLLSCLIMLSLTLPALQVTTVHSELANIIIVLRWCVNDLSQWSRLCLSKLLSLLLRMLKRTVLVSASLWCLKKLTNTFALLPHSSTLSMTTVSMHLRLVLWLHYLSKIAFLFDH